MHRMAADLGFKSVSALARWIIDDAVMRHGVRVKAPTGYTRKPKEIMGRVLRLKPGTRFSVFDVMEKGEERQSVGTTLHYLHREGKIGLLKSARRMAGGVWEQAVFVRKP